MQACQNVCVSRHYTNGGINQSSASTLGWRGVGEKAALQANLLLGCLAGDVGNEVGHGFEIAFLEDTRIVVARREGLPPLIWGGRDFVKLAHVMRSVGR